MKVSTRILVPENKEPAKDIILIHGTGAKGEMWRRQTPVLLEAGFRCILPDLRGHGETHEPEEKTDIEVHLDDILETLLSLDIKFPAIWAGHSLGAIISVCLAEKRPELFKKILAVSLPGRVPILTKHAFTLFLKCHPSIRKSGIHRSLAWRERVLFETHHFTLRQIVENFATLDFVDTFPQVVCPVHFAVGRLDPVAPVQHTITMQQSLPNSTLKIFEWAGHNCMDTQPQTFNKWMMEMLAEDLTEANGSSSEFART